MGFGLCVISSTEASLTIDGGADMTKVLTMAEYNARYGVYPFLRTEDELALVTITSDTEHQSVIFRIDDFPDTFVDPTYYSYPGNVLILGSYENPVTLTIAENGQFIFDFSADINYNYTYNTSYLHATHSTLHLKTGAIANFSKTTSSSYGPGYFYLGRLVLDSGSTATFEGDYEIFPNMNHYGYPPELSVTSSDNTQSYLGNLTMNPGSALVLKDKGKVTSITGPLAELELIGNGVDSATVTITNGGNGANENGLVISSLKIVLTDDFEFNTDQAMLSITSDSTDSTVVGVRGPGPATSYQAIEIVGDITVVDANGQASSLTSMPAIGSTFVVIDKLAEITGVDSIFNAKTLANPVMLDGGSFLDYSIKLSEISNSLVGRKVRRQIIVFIRLARLPVPAVSTSRKAPFLTR